MSSSCPRRTVASWLKGYHSAVLVGNTTDNAAFPGPLITATKVCPTPFCQPWRVAYARLARYSGG